MAGDDLYLEFINKVKKDKSDTEVTQYIEGLLKFGALELYTAMLTLLTEEDMQAIDTEPDDAKADILIKEKFKLRTGVTPEEFVDKLRDQIAKGYLFPVLNQATT